MPEHSLLADLVLTYALALVLVVISARARVPSVVAMILAASGIAALVITLLMRARAFSTRADRSAKLIGWTPSSIGFSFRMLSGMLQAAAP